MTVPTKAIPPKICWLKIVIDWGQSFLKLIVNIYNHFEKWLEKGKKIRIHGRIYKNQSHLEMIENIKTAVKLI